MKRIMLLVIVGLCCAVACAQPPDDSRTSYQANKEGGYDFYRDGKRIAYSKPIGGNWKNQALYVNSVVILNVTPRTTEWVQFGMSAPGPTNPFRQEDLVALVSVLRDKPDLSAKRAVLPQIRLPEPEPVGVGGDTYSLADRAILQQRTNTGVTYASNKSGGYDFFYSGSKVAFSKPIASRQVLYLVPTRLNGFKHATEVLTVSATGESTVSASSQGGGLRLQREPTFYLPGEKDQFVQVLRQKPTPDDNKRHPLPPESDQAHLARVRLFIATDPVQSYKPPTITIKYAPNSFGGWSFFHDGQRIAYTRAHYSSVLQMPGEKPIYGALDHVQLYMPDTLGDHLVASIYPPSTKWEPFPVGDTVTQEKFLKLMQANGVLDQAIKPARNESTQEHLDKLLGK